jgi:hypothetical protein
MPALAPAVTYKIGFQPACQAVFTGGRTQTIAHQRQGPVGELAALFTSPTLHAIQNGL